MGKALSGGIVVGSACGIISLILRDYQPFQIMASCLFSGSIAKPKVLQFHLFGVSDAS
jgi:hypothetical protein